MKSEMSENVRIQWRKVCDTIFPNNPEWIKLLLDWKDAEQADLKEALSACQLQNETNQAAFERLQTRAAKMRVALSSIAEYDAGKNDFKTAYKLRRDAAIKALAETTGDDQAVLENCPVAN